MDLERFPHHHLAPPSVAPVDADLATVAEADADVAVWYAVWQLDRKEDAR